MMKKKQPSCIDCLAEGITTNRPAPYGGPRSPRCATHHRKRKKAASSRNHGAMVQRTYGISAADYWRLYEFQGGRCAICQRATGKTKRLAVDHDHHAGCGHDPKVGCRKCIRGACCATCNRILLGRYSIEMLQRAIDYLRSPPAQRLFNLDL